MKAYLDFVHQINHSSTQGSQSAHCVPDIHKWTKAGQYPSVKEFIFQWVESKPFLDYTLRMTSVRKVESSIHPLSTQPGSPWFSVTACSNMLGITGAIHSGQRVSLGQWQEGRSDLACVFLISIALHIESNLDMDCRPPFNIKKVMYASVLLKPGLLGK